MHATVPEFVVPDILLVLVVFLGLFQRSVSGLSGAFSLGLLGDFASGVYLGPSAAGSVTAFMLSGLIANRVYAEKAPAVFFITAACSLVKNFTAMGLLAVYVRDAALWNPNNWHVLFLEALLCGLLAPLCFKILSRFEGQRGGKQRFQGVSLVRLG